MWDDARLSSSTTTNAGISGTSTYYYDGVGRVASVGITGSRARTVTFTNAPTGQVLSRIESSSAATNPADFYYYVDGVQVGELTSNGYHDPTRDNYSETIVTRKWNFNPTQPPQAFRWDTAYGMTRGQFGGPGYDPVSPVSQGMEGADGRYTVRDGDTLAGIAAAHWGDASLWYLIAEANGLTGSEYLAAGTSLIVPDKVTNIHNKATTFEVYDPNRALGDLSPSTYKPPKKANKCGMFGIIMLAVVAVAVTIATSGAFLAATGAVSGGLSGGIAATLGIGGAAGLAGSAGAGALIAAGAIGGAVGSVVSQGLGVLTGIQDKFSWKGVALGALGGAIGGATGVGGLMGKAGAFAGVNNAFVQGALRGTLSSGLSQGIGVAVGLQKKFDFAGVAAAAVGGGVSAHVGSKLGIGPNLSVANVSKSLAVSMAGNLANAGARSLISGTDFGDNILAALPDVISSTIGGIMGSAAADENYSSGLTDFAGSLVEEGHSVRDSLQAIVDRGPPGWTVEYARAPGFPTEPVILPSDADVIAEVEGGGLRYPRWMRGASRGGALLMLVDPSPTGGYEEFILHGYEAVLARQMEALGNYSIETNGTVVGGTDAIYAGDTRLSHVYAITTTDFADASVNGANAIVVRTIPGTSIRRGFAVTINSEREAEIYNHGVASGWSSNRINNAIRAERRSAPADASFRIGNMRQVFGASGRQARIATPSLNMATRNLLGEAPAGMVNPHRHHILEVNGRAGAHRGIVRDGQDILRAYDIDPLYGIENLVWAPNKGHTIGAATALVNDLRAAQQAGANRQRIVQILRLHGEIARGR